mmetsp:Transcript_15640/g.40283  ORF Transcript_15640/g.40283 Transcript_15640/m.40283 type:complete len:761 (-) Transcript_15640:121-2403(-)
MLHASDACCRGTPSSEHKLRESLFDQAAPFCPESPLWDVSLPDLHSESEETRLRREAVQFAVTFLGGLAEFMSDTKVVATPECLLMTARFERSVLGEVATRSKMAVIFEAGRKGKIEFRVTSKPGCARVDIDEGSLFSVAADGTIEAGNRFFAELAERGEGIGQPTLSDADRVADRALDWWEGTGVWEGGGRGSDFGETKVAMVYDSAAKSKYGSMVPRSGLGHLLLGSLCATPKEYRVFEWYVDKRTNKTVVHCDCFDSVSVSGEKDKFPTWRNALAKTIEESTISQPVNRKMAEKFAASATHFVSMRYAKGLGLRLAASEVVLRLFSPCRCPSTARQWDMLAQEWQKTKDITYSCAGESEGRIVWRKGSVAPGAVAGGDVQEGARAPGQAGMLNNGMFQCCMNRPSSVTACMGTTGHQDAEGDFDGSAMFDSAEREAEALHKLQRMVSDYAALRMAVERHRKGENFEAFCLRFVRARPRSVAAALAMIEADMEWRDSEAILALATMQGKDVLAQGVAACGRNPSEVNMDSLLEAYQKHMPHGLLGFDRAGRPVIYKGFNEGTRLKDLVDLGIDVATMVRYQVWLTERLLHAMGHRGQWTVVFDLGGLPMREMNVRGLSYTYQLMKLDADHFPERLHQTFVINAPGYLPFFWRRISTWIDAKTRNKLQLLSGRDDWARVAETLDLRKLPVHLGGETVLSLDGLCPSTTGKFPACSYTATKSRPEEAFKKASKPAVGSMLQMVLVALVTIMVAMQLQAMV